MTMASQEDADTEWGRAIDKPGAPIASTDATTSSTEAVDIAICGGGLVGLAVAIGLLKKLPHLNIKVYERAPELRSKSQGILSIHPNGMNALQSIDPEITSEIRRVGCERHSRVITNIDADGGAKDTVVDTRKDSEKYGQVPVGITWHNCQQVLASLVPRKEDTIAVSKSLSHFIEHEKHVLLHFEDGSSSKARIMLACDGVFSAARRQMFPGVSPIWFGQLNWGTVIESSRLPPNLHEKNQVHYFQHHGEPKWMSMLNDGGNGYTIWQFRVSDPKHSLRLSGNDGRGGLGLPGVKEKIVKIARESCETVASAIEAIPEEVIFERSIVGNSSLKTWLSTGGRVALVGDSAHGMHPNIAQGANSAFESAAAIVKELCESQDNLVSALASYEDMRKPRVDIVQSFANAMGVLQATGESILDRDQTGSMLEWIRCGHNPKQHPAPADVVEILAKFDPLGADGVRPLWDTT